MESLNSSVPYTIYPSTDLELPTYDQQDQLPSEYSKTTPLAKCRLLITILGSVSIHTAQLRRITGAIDNGTHIRVSITPKPCVSVNPVLIIHPLHDLLQERSLLVGGAGSIELLLRQHSVQHQLERVNLPQ
jgi:hypothetical protein